MSPLSTFFLLLALAFVPSQSHADQGGAGQDDASASLDLTLQDQTSTEEASTEEPSTKEPSTKEPGAEASGGNESTQQEPPAAPTEDPVELFVTANTSYEEGNAGRAVQLYQLLLEQGYGSAELHYNLGNAYLRNGELGRAIASYRRSSVLQPRDEDVAANLSFARKSIKDAVAPPQPSAIASTLFFWHYTLSRGELALVVILLNFLFFALLAVRLFSRGNELLRWATMVVLLLLLTTGISLGLRSFAPQRIAVIIPQEIGAHNGPDPGAVVRFKLHAGSEVHIEDSRDGWLRIRLSDGKTGWIQRDWAEIVEL